MKLAYWMYAGPAHIGTLRIASSFQNVHAMMHAPLGDDYFNVMRSMLERERDFTPVTASIVDRHVLAKGSQEKVIENITRKEMEESPDLIVLTPTCTSSILQEDLENFVERAKFDLAKHTNSGHHTDVILADVNHYRVNELQAADRTLEQIVRFYIEKSRAKNPDISIQKTEKPSVNILGTFTLGFHHQHDCRELKSLFSDLGVEVNEIVPEGGLVSNLQNLPKAWLNVVPYREVGLMTAVYLEKEFGMPYVSTTPMGILETAKWIREIGEILELPSKFIENYIEHQTKYLSQSSWFSRSIDCQNLTGKKVVVFGDSTHAAAMTKILAREMGIHVCCAGTYCKHDADWFREEVHSFCDQILITEDHTQVGEMIQSFEPSAIFGTQMERHVGKRLDIPCGVISAPVHIQNFPLGYKPFLGYEGSNQIADLVYNSFNLGMEDHLLQIFGGHDTKEILSPSSGDTSSKGEEHSGIIWSPESLVELKKIPGFVREKVRKNTENYAKQKNIEAITVEVMFAAKEALSA